MNGVLLEHVPSPTPSTVPTCLFSLVPFWSLEPPCIWSGFFSLLQTCPFSKMLSYCYSLGSFVPHAYPAHPGTLLRIQLCTKSQFHTNHIFLCPSLRSDCWVSSFLLDRRDCHWGVHRSLHSDRWLKALAESTFFESCPPSVWSQPSVLLLAWFAITFGPIVCFFFKVISSCLDVLVRGLHVLRMRVGMC